MRMEHGSINFRWVVADPPVMLSSLVKVRFRIWNLLAVTSLFSFLDVSVSRNE